MEEPFSSLKKGLGGNMDTEKPFLVLLLEAHVRILVS